MKSTRVQSPPLLIEWSPGSVRVFDPITRGSTYGLTIAECVPESQNGREAIIAVSQRSAFIRTLHVPSVSREETAKILDIKLTALLPLSASDYVSGFRLGHATRTGGRTAVVGVVKTESLRKIHSEADARGLRIRAILPLAFGSWLATAERSLPSCTVVDVGRESLNVDVVIDQELLYSRSIPLPETLADIQEEIARTFTIAEVKPTPILTSNPDVPADLRDKRQPIEHLADPHMIDRLLFTLELPEKISAERKKTHRQAVQRAIVTAVIAISLGLYALRSYQVADAKASAAKGARTASLAVARQRQHLAIKRAAQAADSKTLIDAAFRPAQTFGDIVADLSMKSSPKSWFTGISLQRGEPFILRGQATSDAEVAKYVDDLAKDPRFRHIKLLFVNKGAIGKIPVVQFSITGHAVGSLPIDELTKEPMPK